MMQIFGSGRGSASQTDKAIEEGFYIERHVEKIKYFKMGDPDNYGSFGWYFFIMIRYQTSRLYSYKDTSAILICGTVAGYFLNFLGSEHMKTRWCSTELDHLDVVFNG